MQQVAEAVASMEAGMEAGGYHSAVYDGYEGADSDQVEWAYDSPADYNPYVEQPVRNKRGESQSASEASSF